LNLNKNNPRRIEGEEVSKGRVILSPIKVHGGKRYESNWEQPDLKSRNINADAVGKKKGTEWGGGD